MCEVLQPDFLQKLLRDHPDAMNPLAGRAEFAEKLSESAQKISSDWVLERIVKSCLLLDPKLRPRIENVASLFLDPALRPSPRIASDSVLSLNDANIDNQLTFQDFYSLDYRRNKVLRLVQKCFAVQFVPRTIGAAIQLLREAALENSSLFAHCVLGYCHYFGIGFVKNEEKAINLFQDGCDAGFAMSIFALGAVHRRAGRMDLAIPLLEKATSLGNIRAAECLARCYVRGHGVEKDEKKAFQLISSAAEAGYEDAEVGVALYFMYGLGTSKNEFKAVSMARRLSSIGNAFASMTLAAWYYRGTGVPRNVENATQLMRQARNQGIDLNYSSWWNRVQLH